MKCDVEPALRVVTREDALKFQADNNLPYVGETSAKTGDGVEEVFVDLAKLLWLDKLRQDQDYEDNWFEGEY